MMLGKAETFCTWLLAAVSPFCAALAIAHSPIPSNKANFEYKKYVFSPSPTPYYMTAPFPIHVALKEQNPYS